MDTLVQATSNIQLLLLLLLVEDKRGARRLTETTVLVVHAVDRLVAQLTRYRVGRCAERIGECRCNGASIVEHFERSMVLWLSV